MHPCIVVEGEASYDRPIFHVNNKKSLSSTVTCPAARAVSRIVASADKRDPSFLTADDNPAGHYLAPWITQIGRLLQ